MTKEAIAKAPQRRAKRTKIGQRNVLNVEGKDPNYAYRIVNDTGDRVLQLQNEDWEICEAAELQIGDRRLGNPSTVSSKAEVSVGGGVKGYVMRKRIEWHEEDQAAKQEYVNQTEAATKQEATDGNYGKLDLNAPR
jgi:hypothetical protein